MIASQKTGASAIGLQQVLDLGSYETAWTWLHKRRRAMVRPGRDRLAGVVEVDEAFIGGIEEGVRGRQTETEALIAVACEEDGEGMGRIRMRRIPDATADSLQAFIPRGGGAGQRACTPTGSSEFLSYDRLHGYGHRITFLKGSKGIRLRAAAARVPGRVALETLAARTRQGAVSRAHPGYYLDEFTFRFTGAPGATKASCSSG